MPLAPRIPFQWADQAYRPGRMYLINTALRPPQLSIKKGRQCRTVGLGGRGGLRRASGSGTDEWEICDDIPGSCMGTCRGRSRDLVKFSHVIGGKST